MNPRGNGNSWRQEKKGGRLYKCSVSCMKFSKRAPPLFMLEFAGLILYMPCTSNYSCMHSHAMPRRQHFIVLILSFTSYILSTSFFSPFLFSNVPWALEKDAVIKMFHLGKTSCLEKQKEGGEEGGGEREEGKDKRRKEGRKEMRKEKKILNKIKKP